MTPNSLPNVTFHIRVRNEALGGANPFEWKDVSSKDIFAGKRIMFFALPGFFSTACSERHLPGYEPDAITTSSASGSTRSFCLAVNDAFCNLLDQPLCKLKKRS